MKITKEFLFLAMKLAHKHSLEPEFLEVAEAIKKDELEIEGYDTTIDDKPLTAGEVALIKSLRAVEIDEVCDPKKTICCIRENDEEVTTVFRPVSFSLMAYTGDQHMFWQKGDAIVAAINQIKMEKEEAR